MHVRSAPNPGQNIRQERKQDIIADAANGAQSFAQDDSFLVAQLVLRSDVHQSGTDGVHENAAVTGLSLAELDGRVQANFELMEVLVVQSEYRDQGLEASDDDLDAIGFEVFFVAENNPK